MSTPHGTPVRQSRLGLTSAKSLPLANEYKKILCDQHQRLTLKHQQDLDLLDDIRAYVKARLGIERDYTNALQKLAKHHSAHIGKKFALLSQLDPLYNQSGEQQQQQHKKASSLLNLDGGAGGAGGSEANNKGSSSSAPSAADQQRAGNALAANDSNNPRAQDQDMPPSLYKVWYEHINKLQSTSKNRSTQFEQLLMIADKLKDIRHHKATIGKKCLDTHLRRIQEDLLLSMIDVERAKKLYYEDETQARKARENEERIKKKRTGLLTKFTDLQAKKEKSMAQREATDIQSTQARNDYIMALAAANAHLDYYYHRDLNDFIHLIDDGVLDHCKIFMATLSECDINSLKETLHQAQQWSRQINATGSQQTNYIFLESDQSKCLRSKQELVFEACNQDPIAKISLEHNADYALQHEIDKWFTWFKKECRNLSHLMHQLDICQHALAEGKKSVEINGQVCEDLEPKLIELKQLIRKCEAAKLKAQARLKVIKEGGMQIEEWSDVELEIRADMARAHEEEAQQSKRLMDLEGHAYGERAGPTRSDESAGQPMQPSGVQLEVTDTALDSDDELNAQDLNEDEGQLAGESLHNLASVSRSPSNLVQKQQNAASGYSALTDPSLVWQDDYSSAWGGGNSSTTPNVATQPGNIVVSNSFTDQPATTVKSPTSPRPPAAGSAFADPNDPLGANQPPGGGAGGLDHQSLDKSQKQQLPNANMSIQSSSPLSAIVNGGQHLSQSPYQVGLMSEAYKSDYECDYTRTGHHTMRSAASSAEPNNRQSLPVNEQLAPFADGDGGAGGQQQEAGNRDFDEEQQQQQQQQLDVARLLNQRVIALYTFEKSNEDDLAFQADDLLVVTETNPEDTNWIKAQHETSGEQGYIPSSYVRLYGPAGDGAPTSADQQQQQQSTSDQPVAATDAWQSLDQAQSTTEVDESNQQAYCRARYDYTPEANTFEDDGLPHLALEQGELMKVIDQGADDGWWLVEKENTGVRGHVPSMLVEEVDPNEEDGAGEDLDEEDDEFDDDDDQGQDDGDDGDVSDRDQDAVSKGPPPSFEAPILNAPQADEAEQAMESAQIEVTTTTREEETSHREHRQADEAKRMTNETKTAGDSLVPTSFIIIEPTPEVESRRFEDDLPDEDNKRLDQDTQNAQESHTTAGGMAPSHENYDDDDDDDDDGSGQSQRSVIGDRQMVHTNNQQPPSGHVSYAVVNEDFVLEKPTRKPHSSGSIDHQPGQHHHEPTIQEEEDNKAEQEAAAAVTDNLDADDQCNADSSWPAPPSVVIDSVEAIPRSPDLSFDEDDGAAGGGQGGVQSAERSESVSGDLDSSQHSDVATSTEQAAKKPVIRHTGNVDVSPILRHQAEEFCKQLIEEAILLAPGSRIGPSTSSASVGEDGRSESRNSNCNFEDEEEDANADAGRNNYQLGDSFEDST